ncbi:MAG: RNase adapter RapZ [Clostridia bacterium]|nr:RNase adapter RapZ [Clostridia bacterium]
MELILITGMSGSGKSCATHAVEDLGYYCIDNMPSALMPRFVEMCAEAGGNIRKAAFVADVRGENDFSGLARQVAELREAGHRVSVLFLECDDDVLVNRYKENRRVHPLQQSAVSGSVSEAIAVERQLLAPVREVADYRVDTSLLSVRQLQERIKNMFEEEGSGMAVTVYSFGFKHGIPSDADLVLDVRCLPNPFYVEGLREQTGLDDGVYHFVMAQEATKGLLPHIDGLLDYTLPLYREEGKNLLVLAIGCTGGHHRSVTLAQYLGQRLSQKGHRVKIIHRDIQK